MPERNQPRSGTQMLQAVAGELYYLGTMLLGEGEATIHLVERAIATAEIPACADPETDPETDPEGGPSSALHSARVAMAASVIELLSGRDSRALATPVGEFGPPNCIGDDDLDAAGVSAEELERLVSGPGREQLREWLEGLPVAERTIFVLRAVAGLSTPEVAGLLALHGGEAARGWMTDAVRNVFRQALCSLASQLLQDSASR